MDISSKGLFNKTVLTNINKHKNFHFKFRHWQSAIAYSLFIIFLLCPFWTYAANGQKPNILTQQERDWLESHPVIKLAPDPDFPPIEFLDENGNYQGIAADYTRLVEEILGITIQIEKLDSWNDVLDAAQARSVDMFGAASESPQRREYMNFTTPHIELPGVIIVRKDVDVALDLEKLKGLRIAVISGYIWQDQLNNDHPDLELDLVADMKTGLQKVSFGMVDAMVANLATATYTMEKEGITNLKVAGESGYYGRYAFAIRSDWPELTLILQKALDTISPDQDKAILKRWVGFEPTTTWAPDLRFLITASILIVLVIIGAILSWNIALKRQVRQRTQELKQELSERKRAEFALSTSEDALRRVFDSVYDAIFILNLDGSIIQVNRRMLEMFTVTADEVVEMAIAEDFSEHGIQQQNLTEIWRQVSDGKSMFFEWRACRPHQNQCFDAEVHAQRISLHNGDVILATVRDISERKKIDALKNEFVSTVSHELRTPLTAINGSLGLILGGMAGELPEQAQELLKISQRNSDRLLQLINDILDIEKLEAGKMPFNMQEVDLIALLKSSIEVNQAYAKQLNVGIEFKTELTSARVSVDPDRFSQIMANLLSNASKFSPTGDVICIRLEMDNKNYRVSVIDHGPGIPEDFKAILFEKFTQVDASDTRRQGGTGLGLSISRTIIDQMNGTIGFESKEGQGSNFYFHLPAL